MKKIHRHKTVDSTDYGYTKCVAPEACNPIAHGAVCAVEVCRCGWIRETNRNSGAIEIGAWRAPRPGDYPGILKLLTQVKEEKEEVEGKERDYVL